MMDSLLKRIEINRKAHARWIAMVLCLSMLVSLGTFAGFHKTAVAKVYTNEVLDCPYAHEGAEKVAHTHNDDCYDGETLVCSLPEIEAHTHSEECYSEREVLRCTLEENPGHQHTEACYTEWDELRCGLEENPGHQHTAACYNADGALICTIPEGEGAHTHSPECYETMRELTCTIPEGEGAHTHTAECYETVRDLICNKPELPVHVHGPECFRTEEVTAGEEEKKLPEMPVGDPNADLETASDWERDFDDLEFSGNWAADLVLVAATQQGHGESPNNFEAVLNDAGDAWVRHGYTRYGAWYGAPYAEEWSAMFVSFCLRYAGIPAENVPNNPTAALMAESFSKGELFAGRDYVPAVGDLIFFNTGKAEGIDHMGIVCYVDEENGTINTVEGDRTDAVETFGYYPNDEQIVGYGILPQNPDYVPTEEENNNDELENLIVTTEQITETTVPAVPMPAQSWERTAGGIKVSVEAPEGAFPENTRIAVTPVNGNSLKDTVSDAVSGEVLEVQAVDITFFDADGHEIEPAIPIRVVMTPAATQHAEEKTSVVHVDVAQQTAELVEQAVGTEFDNSEVVFDADAFTIYAIVYTYQVEYEYEVDGKTFTSSMPGAENMTLTQIVQGLGIVGETEIETFVSKIQSIASTNEEVAIVTENNEIRVLKDGEAKIVITMQDGAKFHIDVRAEGETSTSNETATVSTKGDLYLPADAELKTEVLDEVKSESAIAAVEAQEGTANRTAAAAETAYQVFDISLENVEADQYNGFQVEVKLPENVVGKNFHLYHVHDGKVDELELDNTAPDGETVLLESVSFVTPSFSEFVLSYTVDFEYEVDGKVYQYSMQGGESILLSELAEILGLQNGTDYASVSDFIANIENVWFSDESLVRVTQIEGDWLLESLQPFNTDENLTITMKNGDVVTVKVMDAQYADITSLMSSVSINGATKNADGSYNVFPGTPYSIDLKFEETREDTFNRSGSLTYKLPDGVKIPKATSGTIVPSDVSLAEIYSINYTIATDGTITFSWDVKPGKEQDFLQLPGMFIGLNIEAEFDESATTIDWHGAAQVTVDQTHDVGVNKSANLGQDGYMYYTVTVTSTGDNKNILLTDTISGTALTLDQNSITETTNHGATFSNKTNKGFDISIPELKHGESATITYRAKVDYDVLASEAGVEKGQYGTVTTTGNQIRINGTDDNPDNNTSETHADHNISFSSTGKGVTEGHYNEETGKRTMNWQIKANDEHRTTISYIHDEMGEGADKMNYSGEGITVKVVNPDWSVAATYTVPWSQLGVNASSTEWTYNIPDQYKNKNYSFVIDYTTDVDVSDSIVPVTVKNDAETDYGEGEGSGKADPAPGSKLDMEKSVVETDIPGGTVTWSITVDVPATGLDSCVVTDTLPTVSGPKSFTDGFDSSSFSAARDVSGLIDGETVSLDTTQSGKVIFTFYKDGQPGLYPVEGGRKVTITLTTTLDEDWMAYEITQDNLRYYNTHTNNAKVVANNYTVEDSASVTVNSTEPSMIKKTDSYMSDNFHWQNWDAENNLKAWMYRLYLYGISDDTFTDGYLEITDTFDDRYLAYYDPDNTDVFTNNGNIQSFHQKLTHGSENGNYNDPVDIEATVSGGTITFRIPKSAFVDASGNYDRYYHVSYFLHVKDKDTIQKMDEDALAAGGTLKIKNTAVWAYSEPTEVEVEHKIPIIEKDYTEKDEAAGVYEFVIKVNEGGEQLGDGDYLEVTDSYTNLTIDYATLICEPEDALLSYTHSGNTVTYFIKNGMPVTLLYTASALTSGAFSNTVEVNNQSVTKTGTASITSRGTTGAHQASIKILKHSGSNLLEGIENVQFELYEYDENYPNNYNSEAKALSGTYSTNANGMFTILHIPLAVEDGSYTTHTKKYVLHEVEPPEGYKALPHDYVFTVDTQTASYGQYIYLHDDTLPISNEPVKEEDISITVNKTWPDGDADLPELIRVRLYQKDSRTASAASAIEVDVVEMTRGTDGSWTHTFTGLDPEKAYFIKEDPVEGYTASYSSNNILGLEQSGTINITNTKDEPDDETTSITVKKKWMQGEEEITDIEQKKDLSATVELVRYRAEQTGTTVHFINAGSSEDVGTILLPRNKNNVTLTADVTGSGTWAYLTSYTAGKQGHEYVNENNDSIHSSGHINGGNGISVTINTPDVSDIYIVFCYGTITSITANTEESIGGSGEGTIDPTYTSPETITLDRENGWRASFSDLPTSGTGSDDGKAYSYTYGIREKETSDTYFAFDSYSVGTYDGEGSNNATVAVASGSTVTVTNKKEAPQTGSLKLTKVVQVDGDTPSTDAEKNLVNGNYVFIVSSGNSIVKYVQITVTNGAPASYKIADTQEGLASVASVEGTSALVSGLDEGDYVITEIEKNRMTLKEAARGDNDTDAVSEDNAVTVHVTAGENEPADSSAAAATFTNNIETVTAKVVKVWDHAGNTGTHPGSLNVTLSNGETYELNEGNNWTAEVTDLPKYDRTTGNLIEYSWTEAELPAGYYLSNIQETTDTATGVITTTLTNSYTDHYNPTTIITGKKVWDDGGEGRPDSITVNLYKDGGPTPYRTITVQAPKGEGANQNEWPFEFTNLPVFNSDGSVVQYTVEEVLPTGYTDEYGIKIDFSQATYIAGETTANVINSYSEFTMIACDGVDLGYIVIRHGQTYTIWTPRPLQSGEWDKIKEAIAGAQPATGTNQFSGLNDPHSLDFITGVPATFEKNKISVSMNDGHVVVHFFKPSGQSDLAYGQIPYTYTQAGGEGGGTITNTKKNTDIEFGKQWIDISQQEIEWDQDIQVIVSRNKGDGTKDAAFSLVYNIAKTSVDGATGGTAEFSTGKETDPKLKLTITTEGDKKKYSFKIENLAYFSETDGKYTYYVEETYSQLTGYLAPSYTNTSAPTGVKVAYDGGTIINKQEGGYELPNTGGIGTTLFTALGGLMTATAGAILTMKSYRRRKENA